MDFKFLQYISQLKSFSKVAILRLVLSYNYLKEFKRKSNEHRHMWHLIMLLYHVHVTFRWKKRVRKTTWFVSIFCKASPRVKIIAWFWFSALASPISVGGPGSLMRYISYKNVTHWWISKTQNQCNSFSHCQFNKIHGID